MDVIGCDMNVVVKTVQFFVFVPISVLKVFAYTLPEVEGNLWYSHKMSGGRYYSNHGGYGM